MDKGTKILLAWFGGMIISLVAGVWVVSRQKQGKKVVPTIINKIERKNLVENMQMSKNGIDFLKRQEGLRTTAYQDTAGVWTIGYGHTEGVSKGMNITEKQAEDYLKNDLQTREKAVRKALLDRNIDTIQPHVFDMMVSHRYNTGNNESPVIHYAEWGNTDTLWDWWNTHYITAKGEQVKGLVNRRNAEVEILKKGY